MRIEPTAPPPEVEAPDGGVLQKLRSSKLFSATGKHLAKEMFLYGTQEDWSLPEAAADGAADADGDGE